MTVSWGASRSTFNSTGDTCPGKATSPTAVSLHSNVDIGFQNEKKFKQRGKAHSINTTLFDHDQDTNKEEKKHLQQFVPFH